MAELDSSLDEWGHVLTKSFANGSIGAVIPGPNGVGRLVYARNGDPGAGYDRVYWYEDVEAAIAFLGRWDGMTRPEGFIRDLQAEPIDWREETG